MTLTGFQIAPITERTRTNGAQAFTAHLMMTPPGGCLARVAQPLGSACPPSARLSTHHPVSTLRAPKHPGLSSVRLKTVGLNAAKHQLPDDAEHSSSDDDFIREATQLGQAAQVWASPHPEVTTRGPSSVKTQQQAALLLAALAYNDPQTQISEQAAQLLVKTNALETLPDTALVRLAKTKDSPLAKDALAVRNEKLMPLYEKWLAADGDLNDALRVAILTVAAAYPLHSAPSGFNADKLAILCSFAGGAYPGIQPEIQQASATYVALHLRKIPFFALWALVVNLSDRPAPPTLNIGPKVEDVSALERLLEHGEVPDEVALPWERSRNAPATQDLGRLAANELCARLLVERERLPRETAFLFLGRRASVLTAFVIATTVLPVVFPKLTPRQRLGLVGALAVAAAVHAVMVPALNGAAKAFRDNKYLRTVARGIDRFKDHLTHKQQRAAEHTREKLFSNPSPDETTPGDAAHHQGANDSAENPE